MDNPTLMNAEPAPSNAPSVQFSTQLNASIQLPAFNGSISVYIPNITGDPAKVLKEALQSVIDTL